MAFDAGYDTSTMYNCGTGEAFEDFEQWFTSVKLLLSDSSLQLKEKHLDTFEEFLKYHCEKIDDYEYKYKGYQYWKNTLNTIYKQKVKDNL